MKCYSKSHNIPSLYIVSLEDQILVWESSLCLSNSLLKVLAQNSGNHGSNSNSDRIFLVLVKAFTASINVYGVFQAGGPWSQVTNS